MSSRQSSSDSVDAITAVRLRLLRERLRLPAIDAWQTLLREQIHGASLPDQYAHRLPTVLIGKLKPSG